MIDVRAREQETEDPTGRNWPPVEVRHTQQAAESDRPSDPNFPGLPSNRPAFGALFPILAAGCLLSLGVFGLIAWGIVALLRMVSGA